jgi:hypothetical protein
MGKIAGRVVVIFCFLWRTRARSLNALLRWRCVDMLGCVQMQIPQKPANLTPEQVAELNQKLSHMRHEINNQLSLVVAALELIRFKPDSRDKMLNTISEQPNKIIGEMQKFSAEFEKTFQITRD